MPDISVLRSAGFRHLWASEKLVGFFFSCTTTLRIHAKWSELPSCNGVRSTLKRGSPPQRQYRSMCMHYFLLLWRTRSRRNQIVLPKNRAVSEFCWQDHRMNLSNNEGNVDFSSLMLSRLSRTFSRPTKFLPLLCTALIHSLLDCFLVKLASWGVIGECANDLRHLGKLHLQHEEAKGPQVSAAIQCSATPGSLKHLLGLLVLIQDLYAGVQHNLVVVVVIAW